MALFSRKKSVTQTSIPAEVQDYYQAERRERTGVAWLLAIATLVVTIILALVLFFGGRWLYREVRGTDQNTTTPISSVEQSTQESNQTSNTSENKDAPEGSSGTTGTSGTSTPAPAPTPTTPTPPSSNNSTTPGASQTTPSTSTPQATNTNPTPLPSTGPSDIIGIVASVSVAATLSYSVIMRRKPARERIKKF